jgi:hypothetical protein
MKIKNENDSLNFYLLWSTIGAVLFSLESWILGPLSWIYGYGSGLETIPTYLAFAFDDRNFSFWSPFIAGGLDRLAFWGNATPFSFEQFLFSNLPTWLANGVDRYLQYFVAIFFTSKVVKEQFHLNARWSIFSGWLMGCFSYLTVGALFTISGVPLLAWVLYRLVNSSCRWFVAFLLGILFSFCTTFSFGVPYLITFMLGWLLIVHNKCSFDAMKKTFLFSIGLVLATSPQLLAIIANVGFSHRSNWPAEQVNFTSLDGFLYRQLQFDLFAQDPLLSLITLNLPGVGMLIGLVFSLWGLRNRVLRIQAILFIKVFVLYALLSQKWFWITIQEMASKIFPWVMGIYMGRFYQIPGSFLIAIGLTLTCYLFWNLVLPYLDRIFYPNKLSRYISISIVGMFVVFMIFAPKWHLFYSLGIHDWGQKNYQIQALENIKRSENLPFRVVSVLPLQPAYAYAQGLETADGWANIYPAIYRDLWLRVLEPTLSQLPHVKQVLDPEVGKPQDNYIFLGFDLTQFHMGLLPNENLQSEITKGFDLHTRFNLNLLRILNVKYILSEYPLRDPGIRLVHSPAEWPVFAKHRYYATGLITERKYFTSAKEPPTFPKYIQPLYDYWVSNKQKLKGKDIFIYELKNTFPRFRYVNNIIVEPTGKAVLDRLVTLKVSDHMVSAVVEKKDIIDLNIPVGGYKQGKIKLIKYSSDILTLEATVSGNSFLVIANTWNPYWRVEVDGKQRKLIRVNHAQFGLPLFVGEKKIRLYYAPLHSPVAIF